MTEYDNTNRGALFNNDRKQQDSHPDWQGNLNVDGKDYWISAWNKSGSKGDFFSLSVKPKEAKAAVSNAETRRAASNKAQAPSSSFAEDLDDEIPF